MLKQISLRLNNALYNAGLIGFLRVLLRCGLNPYDFMRENTIVFNLDLLEGFTDKYFGAIQAEFEKDTAHYSIMQTYEHLKGADLSIDENKKAADGLIKTLDGKLKSNSYSAGYEIAKGHGDLFEAIPYFQAAKKETEYDKKIAKLEPVIDYLKRNRDIFVMKDIAYTKINQFWTNAAFLNNNFLKTDMRKNYKDYFEKKALDYIQKERKSGKSTRYCIECGAPVNGNEACDMAWINGMGPDVGRKNSHFWNGNVDIKLCPICNIVYSCMPLGFKVIGSDGLFINENSSVEALYRVRNSLEEGASSIEEAANKGFYQMMSAFDNEALGIKVKKQPDNIQIVRRRKVSDKFKYEYSIIPNETLKRMKECRRQFDFLVKIKGTIRKEWFNAYDVSISRVLKRQSLYPIINDILRDAYKNNASCGYVTAMLAIQINIFTKEMDNVKNVKAMSLSAMSEGDKARNKLLQELQDVNDVEAKLRSYVYQLLNALKTKNSAKFLDTVIRFYAGKGEIPEVFSSIPYDEEALEAVGYSYIMGLKGGMYKKEKAEGDV